MDKIKVLLADDHLLVRSGIRALIDRIEDVIVVGETDEASDTLRLTSETAPDIVLLDVLLPGANGLEILGRFTSEFPEVKVIILAMQERREYAQKAISYGAKGCLIKKARYSDLEFVIKAVAEGKTYLPDGAPSDRSQIPAAQQTKSRATPADLTARQREVLRMIAEGYSTRGIGTVLKISVKTVESHKGRIMDRLNIYDMAGLVRYAVKHGFVDLD